MKDKAPATSAFANVAWNTFASGDGPTLPGGYTYYRLVGEMETQSGTAAPILFVQQSDTVALAIAIEDMSAVVVGNTTGGLETLSVPRGIMVYPVARIASTSSAAFVCTSPLVPSLAPGLNATSPGADSVTGTGSFGLGPCTRAATNGLGQIRLTASGASVAFAEFTTGWQYTEGRTLR